MKSSTRQILLIAAVLAIAITASATASSLITSKQIKNGTIETKDLSKKAIKALKGKSGPAGPAGPAGQAGAAGTPASTTWAVFHGNGTSGPTIDRGKGAVSMARTSTGTYTLTFDTAVVNCAWTVTGGSRDSGTAAAPFRYTAELNVSTDPKTLLIRAWDAGGAQLDLSGANASVHVLVTC